MPLLRSILLVVVVALAGCVGAPVADDADTAASPTLSTTTQSPTTSTATQSPTYMNCNSSLHIEPTTAVPENATVVAFEDLPQNRQSEFEQAREGYVTLPGESDAADFWFGTRYVRQDDETFSAIVAAC
ncbi:hypothetical protein C453_18355 [Haloferax elongans ATCC BAA-1513]|uniref:DUF7979 domain-containing protein n=1 Tax=Haloferax elongans ATCC BAA-1513 TaxID=1230453 RepID=M0H8Q8_HALEO|nr:hypothetical protein [Haloferax elongans]ELZ80926.1 hypothetical protein C453_18355 [Haloferax elongans ATCC BAA-1513]